jgi:hypothetical protein
VIAELRPSRCDRARAWAGLAPDGELSQLEQLLLDAHVAHCAPCRCFAAEVAAIARELRVAGREAPARVLTLPPAHVRRSVYARARAVGAVAAVAAMAFGIAARAPLAPGDEGRRTPLAAAPADVEQAELQTIRQLRREALLTTQSYSDRPSRAFGDQPA